MVRFSMACMMAISMSACGGGSGDEGGDTGGDAAAQYAGPIASNDTARGQEIYTNICMACHSDGPPLENIGWEASRVRQQVREGAGQMPPVRESRVSPDDLEAVLAFLVTIGGVTVEAGATDTGGGETPPMDEEPMDEEAPADEEASATDA